MIDAIVDKLVSAAIHHEAIKVDERELYTYSYYMLLEQTFTWVSIYIIAAFLHVLPETIAFSLLFIPLRIFAGGYHARTFGNCYILSLTIYVISVLIVRYRPMETGAFWGLVVLSLAVIAIFSPVADPNKPMTEADRIKYKKIVHVICAAELLITVGIWQAHNYDFFPPAIQAFFFNLIPFILICFVQVAVLVLIGKITFPPREE